MQTGDGSRLGMSRFVTGWGWHPPLLAAAFVLRLPLSNGVPPAGFARPLLVAEGVVAVALVLAAVAFRSQPKGALLVTALGLLLLSHDPSFLVLAFLRDALGVDAAIWVAAALTTIVSATAVLSIKAVWRGRLTFLVPGLTSTLNVFGLALLGVAVLPALPSATHWFDHAPAVSSRPSAKADAPDIYVILLDGYPRADELESRFGFDNGSFLSALASRGFDLDAVSQSNYPLTELTLGSMFSAGYLGESASFTVSRGELRDWTREAFLRGAGTEAIRNAGYELVATAPGWEGVSLRAGADRYLDRPEITDLERFLLRATWIPDLPLFPNDLYYAHLASRVTGMLRSAAELAGEQRDRPLFALIHVPSPHLPLAFGLDEVRRRLSPRTYDHGRASIDLTTAEFAAAYGTNLRVLNQQVLATVDAILAASATPPVIVVMSDHGYSGEWPVPPATLLHNLFASYTPGRAGLLGDAPAPANLLRVLMEEYAAADLGDMLPSRYFAVELQGGSGRITEIADPN